MVSERDIVDGLQRGEPQAFDRLLAEHGARVYRLALRLMRCPEEARDLSQEVFVAIFLNAHRLRGEGSLAGWVHRITRNRALNRLRALGRRRAFERISVDAVAPEALPISDRGRFPRPDEALERQELLAFTQQALASLEPDQLQVLTLHHLHGLSYEAIAAQVHVPVGTVKSRLSRTRRTLKAMLHRWRRDEGGLAMHAA